MSAKDDDAFVKVKNKKEKHPPSFCCKPLPKSYFKFVEENKVFWFTLNATGVVF